MTAQLHADIAAAPWPKSKRRKPRGTLRIFLGMAPGVGKTRVMLQAAQNERLAGRDVLIACAEDAALTSKGPWNRSLARLRTGDPSGRIEGTFDPEVVLVRNPDLAVVDELAHDNAPGCRHPKRYQEVLELLEAGIDVFTTLNVHQVASRSDTVARITGTRMSQTVPDTVLDIAELELVDITPRELLKRIRRGEVRLTPAEASKAGLLDEANLTALRELTVCLFAHHVGRDLTQPMETESARRAAGRHLLALVVPTSNSEPVVRWTRQLADSFHSAWTVLFVESSQPLAPAVQARLARALNLARELGADVVTTYDEDPVDAVLRVSAQRNVSQIVVGNAAPRDRGLGRRNAFVRRLLRRSGSIAVQVVPAEEASGESARPRLASERSSLRHYLAACAAIGVVTLAGFLFTPLVGPHVTALVFLLTVVLLALFVRRGPTLVAAAMSAVVWDYFFLPPVYSFRVTHFGDGMLLGMYFVVALVLGHLTTRIRAQEEAERQRETRATALYLLTRNLNAALGLDELVEGIVEQAQACFRARIAVLLPDRQNTLQVHPNSTLTLDARESALASWVFQHRRRAGRFSPHSPDAANLYLPLLTASGPVGVLGLQFVQAAGPTLQQEGLLEACSQQIAMALDRYRLNELSEKAKLLAESERLSKTLLDSMSHEIRTPIAAIKGATENLAELRDTETQVRREMIAEIQQATERLNRVVGNVLEASRLEAGAVKARFNECDVCELIHVTLSEMEKDLSAHRVTVAMEPGLPIFPMDFVLMQQALTNLLSNAALHTPPGTAIEVGARLEGESLVLSVADHGPGIPTESLPRIFEKFYRAPNSRTGGTGLGLSLVRGFVEAQGGKVTARNHVKGGAVFTIRLPYRHVAAQPLEGDS